MDFKAIFDFLGIDFTLVLLYVCSGLLVKAYLSFAIRIPGTKREITTAWKTLIVGTVICAIWVLIEHGSYYKLGQGDLKKLFVTYIFTTSFYELFLKDTVIEWIIGLFPKKKPAAPPTPIATPVDPQAN